MRAFGRVPPPSGGGRRSSLVRGTRAPPGGARRLRSQPMSARLAVEIARRPRGGPPLPPRRRGRRHDAARQAALEARPGRDRRARGAAAARLGARLGDERQDDDDGDGGRDPRPRRAARPQQLRREPRLRRRLHAARRSATPSSGCSRSTRARCPRSPRRVRPRALCSATSSATSSTATASSSSSPSAGATATARCRDDDLLVVNGDDPQVGDLARERAERDRVRPRRPAPRAARAPARGRLEVLRPLRARRTSTPPRTSATSATTAARPAATRGPQLDVARARDRARRARGARRSRSSTPAGRARVRLPLPGLYNVYNALGAAALAQALGAPLDEIRAGLERFGAAFGRFERIAVGDQRLLMLLIKNPAGANEAVRTLVEGGAPAARCRRAQRRDRRRPGRLLDLGRRLRAAARRLERLVASRRPRRRARAALRLRRPRPEDALEVEPDARARARPRPRADAAGGELVVLPTYTAMLALRRIVDRARPRRAVLGAAREDPRRPPLSRTT